MNILTFDIEEWFHILDNDSTKTTKEWINYEVRIHKNMERILSFLLEHKQRATFFCLGWIAEKYPEIIKEISNNGFEIGSHSFMHQLVYELRKDQFEEDISKSIKILEDLTGKKIKYFRAPGFSIMEGNKWSFEILNKLGIELDCSIFPAHRAHGGFASYNQPIPSLIEYNGIQIKELPINYTSIFSKQIIYSGGGYFRLLPYQLIKYWTKKSNYTMSYFHPRDFDSSQERIKELSAFRTFKSYVGLKKSLHKLDKWISDFKFIDIAEAEKQINWDLVPVVKL